MAQPKALQTLLASLNEPQRQAVLHGTGPMLVLAGAGSGKTRVIIHRIARLLLDGVAAQCILGVTFTNKAARQMRERLLRLAGRGAGGVNLCTFHSLGLQIIKAHPEAAGVREGFCIYDTSDQLSLIRELLRQVKVADRRLDAARILDLILSTKKKGLDEVPLRWGDDYELAAFDLYPRYTAQMRAYNALDFDDLIVRSQRALLDAEVGKLWAQHFDYIMVDEYQDTSLDQLALLRALCAVRQNICVVGDDDQAIYGWRGAVADNILRFDQAFVGAREIVLAQNYRSTGNILAAANAVIAPNVARKKKVLFTEDGAGHPIHLVSCADDEDEAKFACETLHTMHASGVAYRDMAVLYRSNVQSRIFEEELRLENIPYRVVGGQAFFDRKEVRDAMAYLAVLHNPCDEVALRRVINVPARGIGAQSLERLAGFARQPRISLWEALQRAETIDGLGKGAQAGAASFVNLLRTFGPRLKGQRAGGVADEVGRLFAHLGLKEAILAADDPPSVATRRLENLAEVQNALARFETRGPYKEGVLAAFLRQSSLFRDADQTQEPDAVSLMTLHSAKGLEFTLVMFVGMEEDLLPHRRSVEETSDEAGPRDLGEERRLCYVGMTRARQRLYLTHALTRRQRGKLVPRTPSRFLDDLPQDGVVERYSRGEAPTDAAQSDKLAQNFFSQMRDKLGITS